MGLIVYIYRSDHDSDLNAFHRRNAITLVNVDGPFNPTDTAPAAVLDAGPLGNPVIRPADVDTWTMFGGTYAGSSDSRFGDAVAAIAGVHIYGAIPIHDRIERVADLPVSLD